MPSLAARLEKPLMASVLLMLFWLPLPLASNLDWAMAVFIIWVALTAALWAIGQFSGGDANQQRTLKPALPLLGLLLLAQAWVALQWIAGLSVDPGMTFGRLILGLGYCLLFLLTVGLFDSRKGLNWLLAVLVVSGTFQAFYGAAMTLSGIEWLFLVPKSAYLGDATGTFVNRNHLAGYLELTLACGIGLLMALRDNRPFQWRNLIELLMGPKARLRLALVVMVIALVMTHSRMGNTAFFASLLLVGGVFVLLDKGHRLRNSLILASIVLIDMLVISQYFGLEKLKDRVLNTRLHDVVVDGEVVQQANELRGEVFADAWPLVEAKPLIGHGAGSFEALFPHYAGENIRLHFDYAHNDYLQFAIEHGQIGSLPLLAFVLLALWNALRAMWRRESLYRSGVGFGAAMGIVAIGVHSFTDFNLQIPANAATFVVVCAIAVLANRHGSPRRDRNRG